MRKIYFIFTFCFLLLFASFYGTHSYFSDSKISKVNTFAVASVFPTSQVNTTPPISPTGTQIAAGSILINEVNPNGNSDTEWVELFNTTSNAIDLSGWKIEDEGFSDTFPISSIIPAGSYGVIIAKNSTVTVPNGILKIELSSAIGNSLSTTNESLSLRLSDNTIIDSMNWGTSTTYFTPSVTSPGSGKIIMRYPNGADTNTATDWISTSAATLGFSNN